MTLNDAAFEQNGKCNGNNLKIFHLKTRLIPAKNLAVCFHMVIFYEYKPGAFTYYLPAIYLFYNKRYNKFTLYRQQAAYIVVAKPSRFIREYFHPFSRIVLMDLPKYFQK